ncbi:protein HGH [Salix suchowensis]|nr:protein HGH [Salix suchowensis]
MATELEELVGFLSSPSPPVKKAAVEIVRHLTGSEDGLLSLSKHASTVLPSLSQLLKDKKDLLELCGAFSYLLEDAKCSRKRGTTFIPELQCVASLACGGTVQMIARLQFCIIRAIIAAKMVEMGMIQTAMDVLYKPDSSITLLLVMLLVNLTQLDSGIVSLFQIEDEKMQGLFVMKLIYSEEDASKMPLELGNVLSFEREPWNDPAIRVEALESIYLITVQEAGLRAFWSVNGPCILQVGYEDEKDPQVMEAYELVAGSWQ